MIKIHDPHKRTSHAQRKAHVKAAIKNQSPPDFMEMSDEELYRYGSTLSTVSVLENELLHRLEQKLEEENGDYA